MSSSNLRTQELNQVAPYRVDPSNSHKVPREIAEYVAESMDGHFLSGFDTVQSFEDWADLVESAVNSALSLMGIPKPKSTTLPHGGWIYVGWNETTDTTICPICKEGHLSPATHELAIRHGDQNITVRELEHSVCDACGEEPVLTEQIRRNQRKIADAKRCADHLLSGDVITVECCNCGKQWCEELPQ